MPIFDETNNYGEGRPGSPLLGLVGSSEPLSESQNITGRHRGVGVQEQALGCQYYSCILKFLQFERRKYQGGGCEPLFGAMAPP